MAVAERFIAAQGYTKAPPSSDARDFQSELMDFDGLDVALAVRHDMLSPHAYAVSCGTESCTVVFEYSDRMKHKYPMDSGQEVGRWVWMNPSFLDVKIGHRDILLRAVGKNVAEGR